MKIAHAFVYTIAAVALLAMPARAQQASQSQPPASQQPAAAATTEGELLRVDATAKAFSIRTAQGTQMQFKYTDDTKVVGAERGVAGLATMAGPQVIVRHTKQGEDNIATQIEVMAKK